MELLRDATEVESLQKLSAVLFAFHQPFERTDQLEGENLAAPSMLPRYLLCKLINCQVVSVASCYGVDLERLFLIFVFITI